MAKEDGYKNLIPTNRKTKEEARELGRIGGIKSGVAKREKKLLSEIYADLLAKEHEVTINGKKTKIRGHELVNQVAMKVLHRGDGSSVSMLKEIREATEGTKIINDGEITLNHRRILDFEPPAKELT